MSLKMAFFALCVGVKTTLGAWIKIMAFPLQIHQYLREQFCHESRRVNYIWSVIWYCSRRALRNNFFLFPLDIRKPVTVQRRVEFEKDECQTWTSFLHRSHLYPITHSDVFWTDFLRKCATQGLAWLLCERWYGASAEGEWSVLLVERPCKRR